MRPAPDGAEQGAQQQEVVIRLFGTERQLHRPVYDGVEVGLKEGIIYGLS